MRAVARDGNRPAIELISRFSRSPTASGAESGRFRSPATRIRDEYREHDAEKIFEVDAIATRESEHLHQRPDSARARKPSDCPAFGKQCTPQTPLGATMVSAEGACAAYYQYGRYLDSKNRRQQTRPSRRASAQLRRHRSTEIDRNRVETHRSAISGADADGENDVI